MEVQKHNEIPPLLLKTLFCTYLIVDGVKGNEKSNFNKYLRAAI